MGKDRGKGKRKHCFSRANILLGGREQYVSVSSDGKVQRLQGNERMPGQVTATQVKTMSHQVTTDVTYKRDTSRYVGENILEEGISETEGLEGSSANAGDTGGRLPHQGE